MIRLYFILMGFVSAFAYNQWVPIPMLISASLFILLFFKLSLSKKLIFPYKAPSVFLYVSLFIIYLAGLLSQVNNMGFYMTGANHAFSYIIIIIMYQIVIGIALVNSDAKLNDVIKYIVYGVLIVSCISLTEFISKNFLGIDFDSLIPRSSVKEYPPVYFIGSKMFNRSRGVAEESGYSAMYLIMFLPFVFYYFRRIQQSNFKLFFACLFTICAIISTFSTAGFLELLISLILCALGYILFDKKIKLRGLKMKVKYIVMFHFSVAVVFLFLPHISFDFFDTMIHKLSFTDSYSDASRISRWGTAIELFKQKPMFGWGPGYTSIVYGTGSTSLYLETLVEYGIIGLSVLILIFLYYFIRIIKINGSLKYVYLFSLFTVSIHLFSTSSMWFPWIWAIFALVDFTHFRNNVEPLVYSKISVASEKSGSILRYS